MTDTKMQIAKMAALYELRLIFTTGQKQEYTTDELVELIDRLAMEKNQEQN